MFKSASLVYFVSSDIVSWCQLWDVIDCVSIVLKRASFVFASFVAYFCVHRVMIWLRVSLVKERFLLNCNVAFFSVCICVLVLSF